MSYLNQINQTADFLKARIKNSPRFGVILGTGLGALVEKIKIEVEIPYEEIPNFPVATVESHKGKLIFGTLADKAIVAMQGRFHYYEGYSMKEVTFPVRVMKLLGIEKLFVSNAAGGVNLDYKVADLMVINDHIDLLPENPLVGPNLDEFGPRFPDMSEPYEQSMIDKALDYARKENIPCHAGVYAAVKGPNLETKAEYRYVRIIGADAVGMSTVPEVMVARHMGLKVFAISAITDIGDPDNLKPINIEFILAAAAKAEIGMTKIIQMLIEKQ